MNQAPPVSYRSIWLMSYPLMISLIIEHMIGLTDTVFLGRVNDVALGASALGGVFYLAMFMPAVGFGTGAQIIMARRNGERRFNRIGPLLAHGCYFMMALAGLLFALSYWISPYILHSAIESTEVYESTIDYLSLRSYGMFFSFAGVMFRSYFIAIAKTKILTLNSIVMILSNVALNYCFIFGKGGFPAMGVAGAALASSVAEGVSLLFFIIYTAVKVDKRKYGIRHTAFIFRPGLLKDMFAVSGWTMVQYFLSVSVWFIFFLAIEHLGERPLAVTNIVRNISALLMMVMSAFAISAETLISNQIGAGNTRCVFKICRMALYLSYALLLPMLLLICLLPEQTLGLFTDDLSLIEAGKASLFVMASATLLNTPTFVIFSAVSGTGNTRAGFIIEMITLSLYTAAIFFFIIRYKPDVALCWFSEHLYALVMLGLSLWYLKSGKWKGKKV